MTSKTKQTMIEQLGSEKAYKQHMAEVGRLGHRSYSKKLTTEQEAEIIKSKESSLKLAPKYGVSASLIRHIRNKQKNATEWLDQIPE